MKRFLTVVSLIAFVALAVLSVSGKAQAEEFKIIGIITKIEIAGPDAKTATATLKDNKTEKLVDKTIQIIQNEVGPGNVGLTLGFVGVQNAAYPINTIYLWTSGPQEAVMQLHGPPRGAGPPSRSRGRPTAPGTPLRSPTVALSRWRVRPSHDRGQSRCVPPS